MTSIYISEDVKGFTVVSQIVSNRALIGLFGLGIVLYFLLRRDPRLKYHLKQLGGPPSYPVIGTVPFFIRPNHEMIPLFDKWVKKYGYIICTWMGYFNPYVVIAEPDAIEKVLSSTVHIDKGKYEYSLMYDWLGWGLITAPKHRWVKSRKLLTPAFHFKILNDFLPVFNNQASILLDCLSRDSVENGETFDMFPYLTKLTTDVLCETAMGTKLNAQTNSSNQKYCDAVANYATLVYNKTVKPWLKIPLFQRLTSNYKAEMEYVQALKELPVHVIKSKKLERQQKKLCKDQNTFKDNEDQAITVGRENKAFLDILLDTSENNPETFTEKNVQEEVATFMFAGHDTTAVFFMWALHLLANHPECQQKLQQELDTIFIDNPSRDVTLADLTDMKYLECCVKEILRLYPSVPFIMRRIDSDILLKNGKIIPKGVTVLICIYYTHRHPDYYEDPNEFKPERWFENTVKRHPYSYIPFSAGPRNCIGQKYALMEAKVVLAKILRTYWIEPVDKLESLRKIPHVVLRCVDGVRVKLQKRKVLEI